MKYKFYIIYIIILLLSYSKTFAQNSKEKEIWDFVSLNAQNGLSNSHINDINQDQWGYIWVATNDGLNRYNGLNIEKYYHDSNDSLSINNSLVYHIYKDNNNNLWFGTFTGISKYDYSSGNFINYTLPEQENAVNPSPVRAIVQTPDKKFWLGTSGTGLVEADLENNKYTFYRKNSMVNSICSDFIQCMTVDKTGRIWIGTENKGICIFNPQNKTFEYLTEENNQIGSNNIRCILCDEQNNVYVGTFGGGLSVFDVTNQSLQTYKANYNEPNSIPNNLVYSIAMDKNGNVFLGTQGGGISLFDKQNKCFINFSNQNNNTKNLINDNIHTIFFDKDNTLWAGVFQGGICYKKNKNYFENIIPSQNKQKNIVISSYWANKNQLLIGTDGNGLFIYDKENNSFRHLTKEKSDIKSNIIRSVYESFDGTIWIGTYLDGLIEYNPKNGKFTQYLNNPQDSKSLSHNDVTSIIEDGLGNLWVGTNGGGINLLDRQNKTFEVFVRDNNAQKISIINNWITHLYRDKRGFLWVSTFWGLSRLDPIRKEFKNLEIDKKNSPISYNAVLEDSKGRFWAATNEGLKQIDIQNNCYKLYTTSDGLPNNVINAIEEDNQGNIWMSSNNGVCCFNVEKNTFKNYTTEDGLMSNEFTRSCSSKSSEGEIFFGNINGICKFLAQNNNSLNNEPQVVFSEFLIFNQKVEAGIYKDDYTIMDKHIANNPNIVIKPELNSFTIGFNAIEFAEPHRVKYQYRMKGFDNDWLLTNYNIRHATYTNLNAGTYYFEVRASIEDDKWGEPQTLRITILEPWYLSWWAKTIYSLLIVGLILGFWWLYKSRTERKHKEKIDKLLQEQDISLNKNRLQFFTNISHEFRTPLTLILGPLESMLSSNKYDDSDRKRFGIMHRNAQRLLGLVNQIMDLRKLDNNKMQLTAQRGDLVAFIKEIYENFDELKNTRKINFEFSSSINCVICCFDKEKIDKIMYNLISNAFKFTPENGTISLKIEDTNNPNYIKISVSDNGKGIKEENIDKIFDRFFKGDSSSIQQGSGIGLWLTQQFVLLHNGKIEVKSKIDQGTCFEITLPINLPENQSSSQEYQHLDLKPEAEIADDYSFVEFPINEFLDEKNYHYKILIIEDSLEILGYLENGLNQIYQIETAGNGKQGLEKALYTHPDLIITDVMMPEMDGLELCQILKNNINTCHIPIIMLTAKASDEQKISGLETGADSYITKPFNPKHLLVRIKKLLELRKQLKEKFGNEISFNAEQTATTQTDKQLLQKITEIIGKRISDPDLTVETLSEEIGMSRGHLQRKLKSLTGQNPNEFIRIIRLKHAADLLKRKEITISEVSDMVGFNSQSYFSTSFTKQFGISPSQFKESLSA